jgi:hypothetical protein
MDTTAAVQASAKAEPEPSFAASAFVTFLPILLILVMIPLFFRVIRRTTSRAEEALRLYREMLGELRAIRTAVEREGSR